MTSQHQTDLADLRRTCDEEKQAIECKYLQSQQVRQYSCVIAGLLVMQLEFVVVVSE